MKKRLSLLMAMASMVIVVFALNLGVASAHDPHDASDGKGIATAGAPMCAAEGVLDLAGAPDPALDAAGESNPLMPAHYAPLAPPWNDPFCG